MQLRQVSLSVHQEVVSALESLNLRRRVQPRRGHPLNPEQSASAKGYFSDK